jgi:hypothetical protein
MINKIKTANLANKKLAIMVLMLVAFGVGLSSMEYDQMVITLPERNYIQVRPSAGDYQKPASLPAVAPEPAMPPIAEAGYSKVPASLQQLTLDRMVISTSSIGLNVTSVSQASAEIRRIADSLGGFVTDSYIEPIPRGKFVESGMLLEPLSRASLTLRIPAEQLDRATSQIMSLGKLISFSTNSRDVTEQYVDVSARLKNLHSVLEQYKQILMTAKTTQEILAVQQRIDQVQEQIEVLTAQMKRLESQVSMATVTVSLIEPQIVEKPKNEEPSLFERLLLEPLLVALSVAEILARGLLILIVGLLPVYPLAGLGYMAYRRFSRQKRDN